MNAALYRLRAESYRHMAISWRTVCERTMAELAELTALLCEIEADRLEYFEAHP
ncbi:MAG: hypothetical protein PHS14_04870 [Elusimicrobia bacterium]|nr:hypothetical protein [Elusimicrobiota bacterium]